MHYYCRAWACRVGVLFGDVQKEHRPQGMHIENPLLEWVQYDCRQKTHKETMQVPSQDQLLTKFDVSVQYKVKPDMAPTILSETGSAKEIISIHLVPKLRSSMRELGKTVKKSEDFFLDATQTRLQNVLLESLKTDITPKGLEISAILIRDIQLPVTIRKGVAEKKKRDQEAEKEKAELRRFETEQQKKVKTAEAEKMALILKATAEKEAAAQEAEKKKILADAKAYEIEQINKAIAQNPAYIKLEALKALQSISKDPAAKLYFLDGQSTTPLPLMHIGDRSNTPVRSDTTPVRSKKTSMMPKKINTKTLRLEVQRLVTMANVDQRQAMASKICRDLQKISK